MEPVDKAAAEDHRNGWLGTAHVGTLFLLAWALWLLLVWPAHPVTGAFLWGDAAVGAVVAVIVALLMRDLPAERIGRCLNPVRWFWAVIYLVVFAFYVAAANLDVAYRVLHPAMPIRPGIVKVRSTLQGATARTALANSITLTPGTLTVDLTPDGTYYVHWIDVSTRNEEEARCRIVGRFEWFLRRIFE